MRKFWIFFIQELGIFTQEIGIFMHEIWFVSQELGIFTEETCGINKKIGRDVSCPKKTGHVN